MGRIEDVRRIYAEVVTAGVADRRITEAYARVPREHYLGEGPWDFACMGLYAQPRSTDPACLYHNFPVAIDRTRGLNNGEPFFLARMIDALAPADGSHVAHVGTGTGYYTAILAELVGPAGRVTAIEIDPALAAHSRDNLARYPQVEVVNRSGTDLSLAGLDGLYINAGATHPLPCWLDALAPGGRLVLPLTCDWEDAIGAGRVARIQRADTGYTARLIHRVWIFDCDGARDAVASQRLNDALKDERWDTVRSLRRDAHDADETCWLHGAGYCFSTREPEDAT